MVAMSGEKLRNEQRILSSEFSFSLDSSSEKEEGRDFSFTGISVVSFSGAQIS